MWDVKISETSKNIETSQFYLNYVGCKVSIWERKRIEYFSFTLTMWDVKYTYKVDAVQSEPVLP